MGTSGTNKDDKYNKREGKNEGPAAGSTNSAEAPNWKFTAASIPRD